MTDLLVRVKAALVERYAIERELGQGGMAVVFLAKDLKHRRAVAIKVLRPELAMALGAERFLGEIETVAALAHPHILPLYDSGEAAGFLYYVMARSGITINESAVSTIPTTLSPGRSPVSSRRPDSATM